ncbi:MAG TPA: hypothetical protein VK821_20785 [Dehalococcoidia bacterium]|nr:hypothetical protein [Dehalococcoidia bacterium]
MVTQTSSTPFRPMNVVVARGSPAEKAHRSRAGLPGADVIAPGLPKTPAHNLIFHHGKTIPSLAFTNFYVGGTPSWNPADVQAIDAALDGAMSDIDLNNVLMQYFHNQAITSKFSPSQILPGPPPSVVSQGDAESLVADLAQQGRFSGFDLGSTVFNFLLPRGTVLNADPAPTQASHPLFSAESVRENPALIDHDGEDSRHGLGGYHGSVHIPRPSGGRDTIYYAVGVFSERRPDGSTNGIPVFDQPWKNVVATFYHELSEARTDADVEDAIRAGNDPSAAGFLGWMSREGEECGDFPVFEARPLGQVFQEVKLTNSTATVPVQFQYSNAVSGPEGPIPAPHHLSGGH